MANIKIYNLQPAGYDLFSDSESYMMDLSENELNTTHGGFTAFLATVIEVVSNVVSFVTDTIA